MKYTPDAVRHGILNGSRGLLEPSVLVLAVVRTAGGDNAVAGLKVRVRAAAHNIPFDERAQTTWRVPVIEHDIKLVLRKLDAKGGIPWLKQLQQE